MLKLNNIVSRNVERQLCTLCNTNEIEDTTHFLCKCPIIAPFRREFFGKSSLTANEAIEWLNGKNWNILYNFLNRALSYRTFLVAEYNT